jgi:hypothetical protein
VISSLPPDPAAILHTIAVVENQVIELVADPPIPILISLLSNPDPKIVTLANPETGRFHLEADVTAGEHDTEGRQKETKKRMAREMILKIFGSLCLTRRGRKLTWRNISTKMAAAVAHHIQFSKYWDSNKYNFNGRFRKLMTGLANGWISFLDPGSHRKGIVVQGWEVNENAAKEEMSILRESQILSSKCSK